MIFNQFRIGLESFQEVPRNLNDETSSHFSWTYRASLANAGMSLPRNKFDWSFQLFSKKLCFPFTSDIFYLFHLYTNTDVDSLKVATCAFLAA